MTEVNLDINLKDPLILQSDIKYILHTVMWRKK